MQGSFPSAPTGPPPALPPAAPATGPARVPVGETLARFRRLVPFVYPHLPKLLFTFVLSLFGVSLGLVWPIFTKILIDRVLLGKNLDLLFLLCGAMVVATVFGYGVGALGRYEYTRVTARILFQLRQHLFAHLQRLSLRFHAKARVGDLLSRLDTDIAEVQSVLTDSAFTFLTNVLVFAVTVGLLLWLEWKLFLAGLIVVPLQLYAMRSVRPRIVDQTRTLRETNAGISSFLVESLSAIRSLKLLAIEELQLRRLAALGERFVGVVTRYEMLSYAGSTAISASTFLGGVVTTLYGGYLVIAGEMTIGTLVAFTAYQTRAFSPLQALFGLYLRIERSGVSLARIFEFIDVGEEHEEPLGRGAKPPVLHGEIEFRNVSFEYEPGEPVLRDVSFSVRAGGRLTILGPSGSGKSTVIDLLARLYAPTKGTILLDGRDVQELEPGWLRSRIAVVGSDPFLFHGSLLENLRYAEPDASIEDVERAIRTVGLDGFVAALPRRLETPIGEHGVGLSAGQRQRIAIARALLRKPALLVLDEALSGVDVGSELRLREAIDEALPGHTSILATHRLSSVRDGDLVLVLGRGTTVWSGPFRELSALSAEARSFLGQLPS